MTQLLDPPIKVRQRTSWRAWCFFLALVVAVLCFTRAPRRSLLDLIAMYFVANAVFLAGNVLAAKWRGIAIDHVGIFMGVKLFEFRIATFVVRVNCFPTGGYVKYPIADTETITAQTAGKRYIDQISPWERMFIYAGAPLSLLLLAACIRGPSAATLSFVHGFGHVVRGALSPRTVGPTMARQLLKTAQSHWGVALAIFAANYASATFIPTLGSVGNQVTCGLMGSVTGITLRGRRRALVDYAALLFLLPWLVCFWVLAWHVFVVRTN